MKYLPYALATVLLTPVAAMAAASTPDITYFNTLATQFGTIVNTLIPIMLALALLLFIWGVIQYFILGADDEGKRETGRAYMLYAIIGLVAIVAVWGVVGLVTQFLGISTGGAAPTIGVPTTR